MGIIEFNEILQDPSMECTAIAAVADGSRCRMEVRSQPVLVAYVVFHWPARVLLVFCEAEQALHSTQTPRILHEQHPKARATNSRITLISAQRKCCWSTTHTFLVDRHGEVPYTTARVNTARYRRLAIWILYLVVQVVVRRTAQLQRRTSS